MFNKVQIHYRLKHISSIEKYSFIWANELLNTGLTVIARKCTTHIYTSLESAHFLCIVFTYLICALCGLLPISHAPTHAVQNIHFWYWCDIWWLAVGRIRRRWYCCFMQICRSRARVSNVYFVFGCALWITGGCALKCARRHGAAVTNANVCSACHTLCSALTGCMLNKHVALKLSRRFGRTHATHTWAHRNAAATAPTGAQLTNDFN